MPEGRHGRSDKYRGDYERSETYVLPPERGGALLGKYRGDYERNPVYMENLLAKGKGVVPPSHEYTTLAPTTRQPPQQYVTTLTHPSDCPVSQHPYRDQSLSGGAPPYSQHSLGDDAIQQQAPVNLPHPSSPLTLPFPTSQSSDRPHPSPLYPPHDQSHPNLSPTNQSSTSSPTQP